MLFQTPETFIHIQNKNEDILSNISSNTKKRS